MNQFTKYFLIAVPVLPLTIPVYLNSPIENILPAGSFNYFLFVLFIISFVGLVLYVKHLWTNQTISQDKKIMWSMLLFMFLGITQIAYWFNYMKNEDQYA